MSLRIVPAEAHASTFSHVAEKSQGAPSAPGLHDTLRHGVGPSAHNNNSAALASVGSASSSSTTQSAHPLESRLRAWQATQEELRMASLRRTFGMAEPIRRGMELKIARDGDWRPLALGGGGGLPSVHEDVLRGREAAIDWEDVFTGEEARGAPGIHDEMERKLKM